jgi:hypothetical protein
MKSYNLGQNFNIVVSTKATLFGALAGDFDVYYAPTNDLTNRTVVAGGMSEAVETVAVPHEATLSSSASYGATYFNVSTGHDIEAGDVIQYAVGHYAYVSKVTATKLYLRTKARLAVSSGATITQVGNTGLYKTADFGIPTEGEFLVSIEAPEYGIIVESRVGIVDATVVTTVDSDAPIYSEVAVAY